MKEQYYRFRYLYTLFVYIVVMFCGYYIFRNCTIITNKDGCGSKGDKVVNDVTINTSNIDTLTYKLKEIKKSNKQ